MGTTPTFMAAAGAVYRIPLTLNVPVAAGGMYAFLLGSTNVTLGYRSGTGTPGVTEWRPTPNLRVLEGSGIDAHFAVLYAPATWSARCATTCPLPQRRCRRWGGGG